METCEIHVSFPPPEPSAVPVLSMGCTASTGPSPAPGLCSYYWAQSQALGCAVAATGPSTAPMLSLALDTTVKLSAVPVKLSAVPGLSAATTQRRECCFTLRGVGWGFNTHPVWLWGFFKKKYDFSANLGGYPGLQKHLFSVRGFRYP